jgi:N6-adenosine-specific RNA methylase IME4
MSELLPIHPLAELFPALEGEAFDALVEDIRRHGVREEIVFLDGRNRYRAGLVAGAIEPGEVWWPGGGGLRHPFRLFVDKHDGDPLAWVLSRNLHRRHLTESQRAMVAAKLATMGEGRPSSKTSSIDGVSRERAAQLLKVGSASIDRARVVQRDGVAELVAAVESGEIAVSPAMAVAALPKAEQAEIVARGKAEILAAAKRFRDEKTAEKKLKRAEVERRLGAKQRALPDRRYGVILADPEWRFEPFSRETGMDRAPENHYPTSEIEAICARDVGSIAAPDCVLFLWVTAPLLFKGGGAVMAAWGFEYQTHFIWGKDRVGTGYWNRNRHEVLLLATRGNPPCPAPGTQWDSLIMGALGRHSEKPDNFHRLIEDYFPTLPKIELNARAARPGWDVWGNEAEGGE